MIRKKVLKRLTSLLLALNIFVGTGTALVSSASAENEVDTTEEDWELAVAPSSGLMSYSEYVTENGTISDHRPDCRIEIPAASYLEMSEDCNAYLTDYEGEFSVLYWDEVGGTVTWGFDVSTSGYYQLAIDYCAISGKNYDMVMDLYIDGEIPYENVENFNLTRLFIDDTYYGMDDNAFRQNIEGDEIRPGMTEQFVWQTKSVTDAKNEYDGPMYIYLTEGHHEISLGLDEEYLAIKSLIFFNESDAESYAEVIAAQNAVDSTGVMETFEAEKSYIKNDVTLFSTYDTAYYHVTPSSAENVYYNTIGKNTWKTVGQEITWEFTVPSDGYYNLAFKVKQNVKTNAYSSRSVTIDGEELYAEMGVQKFAYSSAWYVQPLENESGESLKVYLTAGKHVLGMTAILDEEFASVLRDVDDVTAELQEWYRKIIKVTGFNADSSRITIDTNRDFNLQNVIPGLMEGLEECKERLDADYQTIEEISGLSGSSASILKEMSSLLAGLIKHPGRIAKRIETFRSDISSLATWTIDMKDQPLVMDKFYVYSPDMEQPEVASNFLTQLIYRFKMFIHSFTGSTTSVAGSTEIADSDTTITVWISTADITTTGASSGRDQAIILKKLIDESFTAESGINVEVSLVSGSSTLIQAVLAGEGPDVALFTSVDTPVNLAMRGALLDLSQFEDYEEVLSEFTESSYVPFEYKDGLYAFPETQSYNLIFYRTDIYDELGLEPPTTWDEFYEQVILLSNENYMVGIPQNQNTFETFLYQEGQSFYSEDFSKSTFDTNEALDAFEKWTGLYTKYSLSLVFDFFNRFRSGELAMGIMPYNQVNYLYSAAPELDGLWSIAPVPGTVSEDGSINSVETCTSTGCIILGDTAYPQESYDFLKWWVSAETQADFGIQVEQTLGIAARYGTANVVAFEELPWNTDQAEVMRQQRENTVAVEQIPGSYYIARNLSFAFRAVVYNHANIRETLNKYNIEINKELERKQKEFTY